MDLGPWPHRQQEVQAVPLAAESELLAQAAAIAVTSRATSSGHGSSRQQPSR
ncbi:hypothetical protein [Kamptonema formosum]|uniref:hypothetical protein n=1 Tax=Kamptonema formosum TaxID=331992 RepID=UPI00034A8D68|nr:hypothetical protein [Oscillatoria sp. PCC 10802]